MALLGLEGKLPGKRVVWGEFTPTAGSTALDLAPDLETVDQCVVALDDVDLTHMWSEVTSIAGTVVTVTHTKPTAANDVTPIAATTPWNKVRYIAVGNMPR